MSFHVQTTRVVGSRAPAATVLRRRSSEDTASAKIKGLRTFPAPFGEAEPARYGELYSALERKGTSIGELDNPIAAHALTLGVTLVTNNDCHFSQVAGLHLEDWR